MFRTAPPVCHLKYRVAVHTLDRRAVDILVVDTVHSVLMQMVKDHQAAVGGDHHRLGVIPVQVQVSDQGKQGLFLPGDLLRGAPHNFFGQFFVG